MILRQISYLQEVSNMPPVTTWLVLGTCVPHFTVSLAQDASRQQKERIGAPAIERNLYRLDPQTPEGLQELLSFSGVPLPIATGNAGWRLLPW